jgi:hypothetical protein
MGIMVHQRKLLLIWKVKKKSLEGKFTVFLATSMTFFSPYLGFGFSRISISLKMH